MIVTTFDWFYIIHKFVLYSIFFARILYMVSFNKTYFFLKQLCQLSATFYLKGSQYKNHKVYLQKLIAQGIYVNAGL